MFHYVIMRPEKKERVVCATVAVLLNMMMILVCGYYTYYVDVGSVVVFHL